MWPKKRIILIKKHAETSEKFGKSPEKRTVEELINYGIINVDKPEGPTSHQVSAHVQKILGIKKSGHSGTLDPKVTGVLPVALGKGTRIVQSLLTAGKEYVCLMQVHADVEEKKLRSIINKFIGVIDQLPPVRSAVKRQQRKRTIYYIDIIEIAGREVLFRIGCQAGTYIRKLCSDIGKDLGTGAHMAELRRTRAGPFDEFTLCTMQELTDAYYYYKDKNDDKELRKLVMPVEEGAKHLQRVWVMDSTVDTICHGAFLNIPGIAKLDDGIGPGDKVAVLTLKDELVSVGIAQMYSEEVMRKDKGLFIKSEQVFMEPGTYNKS